MPLPDRSLSATTVARAVAVFVLLGFAPRVASNETILSVRELRALQPTSGTFTVDGYVSQTYHCPPCPVGAFCKPCMGPHVVLSDTRHRVDHYENLGAGDAIVFATDSEVSSLVIGNRYRVHVEVELFHTTSLKMQDLKLLAVEPAPSR